MPVVIINPDFDTFLRPVLKTRGFDVISIPYCNELALPLQGHPDLQISIVQSTLIYNPALDKEFIADPRLQGIKKYPGLTLPKNPYPQDIAYNIALCGSYYFHRTDTTDAVLKNVLLKNKIKAVHVNQGYTGCSIASVGNKGIITADTLIHTQAQKHGITSLLISPGNIVLPGYAYGFIGGATFFWNDILFFTGSLNSHPEKNIIEAFLDRLSVRLEYLTCEPVFDCGSIFAFN